MGRVKALLILIGLLTVSSSALAQREASGPGGPCGGIAGFRCAPGLACRLESRRGSDRMGVCMPRTARPEICPQIHRPVCGRDGRTYSNDCVLRRSEARLRHRGECRQR